MDFEHAAVAAPPPAPPVASLATSAPPSPPVRQATLATELCPQCHFLVHPEYYYCPNCGKALRDPPLSTSVGTQLWVYAFSIFLPMIAYLAISKWPGIKYFRSKDPGAQQIGLIAIVLLALSTIITFWLTIAWIQSYVQQSVNAVGNMNLGGLGGF